MSSVVRKELLPRQVVSLEGTLSAEECRKHVELCESKGFKQATLNVGKQTVAKEEIRNNATVIVDDKELAELLWNRVKGQLQEFSSSEDDDLVAVGISDHFRFYRYEEGQRFVRHYDGYEYGSMVYTAAQNKPQARLTFLIYLNEEFEGGKTTFFTSKGKELLAVTPQTGSALIYTQKLLHEGSLVTKGTKYVLRSDILFGKPVPQQEQGWQCSLQ